MFRVFCDDAVIYDDTLYEDDFKLVDPVVSFEINSSGSFKMTVPSTNRGYDLIKRVVSTIRVTQDENTIWIGRVMQEDIDYWNQRSFVCEGALAFLNDTILEKKSYAYNDGYEPFNNIIKKLLTDILAVHNSKVDASRMIECGDVDDFLLDNLFADNNYTWESDNETVLEFIQNKLVNRVGGYIAVRYKNNKILLDYKDFHLVSSEMFPASKQKVEFGKNLVSLSRSFNIEDAVSVIIPSGTVSTTIDDHEYKTEVNIKNLDIDDDSFQSPQGEPWLKSKYLYDKLGWIEKNVHWDGTEGATEKHYERNSFPGLIWQIGKSIDATNGNEVDDPYAMCINTNVLLSQQIEYIESKEGYYVAVHGWSRNSGGSESSGYYGVWNGSYASGYDAFEYDASRAKWTDTENEIIDLATLYANYANDLYCGLVVKRIDGKILTEDDKFNIIMSYYVNMTASEQGNSSFLLAQAKKYLEEHAECLKMKISAEAFDLHYVETDTPSISIGDIVKVTSIPHGVNNEEYFVNSIDIHLDKPEETRFHLGNTVSPKISSMV